MSSPEVLVQVEGCIQLTSGLLVLAAVEENSSHVRIDRKRERIELLRQSDLPQTFIKTALVSQSQRVPVMHRGVVGVERNSCLVFTFGLLPIPVMIRFDVRK